MALIVKQVWTMVVQDIRLIPNLPRKFYESATEISEATMWDILSSMRNEKGQVPLIIERPHPWWDTTVMRGKTYSLVPFDKIELISSQEFKDNERIFLSDHIRGTTSEQ